MHPIASIPRSTFTTISIAISDSEEKNSTTSAIHDLLMHLQNDATRRTSYDVNICAQQIADILEKHPTLTELDLSDACIQDVSAEAMIKALEKNKTLTSLNLSDNLLTSCGINVIFKGLKNNSSLLTLDISYNKSKNDNLQTIAEVFLFNTSLTNVNLEGMGISSQNLKILSNILKNNITLTHLDITYEPSLLNENEDSDPEGSIFENDWYAIFHNIETDLDYAKNKNTNKSIFFKEHAVIQSICSRNREKETLLKRAKPVMKLLEHDLPQEIADLLSEKLLTTEYDAATLRRIGDLV